MIKASSYPRALQITHMEASNDNFLIEMYFTVCQQQIQRVN